MLKDNLFKKSSLLFLSFSQATARRCFAFSLLAEPFCLRERRRYNRLIFLSSISKKEGFSTIIPSVKTAKFLTPTSIPTSLPVRGNAFGFSALLIVRVTKTLPVLLRLTVAKSISPSGIFCMSLVLTHPNLPNLILPLSKRIELQEGLFLFFILTIRKDSFFSLHLKVGYFES